MQITLTPLADQGVRILPPDIVWDESVGDFAIATRPAEGIVGGLVSVAPIESAAIMLLFSDARPDLKAFGGEEQADPRGWVGDGFDVQTNRGEAPLGSGLWRYRRTVPNETTALAIAGEAERALQPLVIQGLVDRIVAKAAFLTTYNAIRLDVAIHARGRLLFTKAFDLLWKRVDGRL